MFAAIFLAFAQPADARPARDVPQAQGPRRGAQMNAYQACQADLREDKRDRAEDRRDRAEDRRDRRHRTGPADLREDRRDRAEDRRDRAEDRYDRNHGCSRR